MNNTPTDDHWWSRHSINITDPDPNLGNYTRRYAIHKPSSYDHKDNKTYPLLVYLHGQYETWPPYWTKYHDLGEKHDFISVYPRGMGDLYWDEDLAGWVAWNVGLFDKGQEAADNTCFDATIPTYYASCGYENWSRC